MIPDYLSVHHFSLALSSSRNLSVALSTSRYLAVPLGTLLYLSVPCDTSRFPYIVLMWLLCILGKKINIITNKKKIKNTKNKIIKKEYLLVSQFNEKSPA